MAAGIDRLSRLSDELLLNILVHCSPISTAALKYTSRRFHNLIEPAEPQPHAKCKVLALMILHDDVQRERDRLTPRSCLEWRLKHLSISIIKPLTLRWANSLLPIAFTKATAPKDGICWHRWQRSLPHLRHLPQVSNRPDHGAPEWWLDVGVKTRHELQVPLAHTSADADIYRVEKPATDDDDKARSFCLHILRLRASSDSVRRWRGSRLPSAEMVVLQNQGWTSYLEALAPPKRVLDLLRTTRRDLVLLKQLYDIAALEEALAAGAIGDQLVANVLSELDRQLAGTTAHLHHLRSVGLCPRLEELLGPEFYREKPAED